MEKGQQKTLQNKERETEERYQEPSIELVIKTCGEGIGEIAKSQGSKVQHGSRGKQQRERRKLREKRRSTGIVYFGTHRDSWRQYNRGGRWEGGDGR